MAIEAHPRPIGKFESLRREQVFAFAAVVVLANALVNPARAEWNLGAANAIANGFGVNWAVWLAVFAVLRLSLTAATAPARRGDLIVAGGALASAFAPEPDIAALGASGLAAWIVFSPGADARLRAAGLIIGAITVNIFWTRVLLLFTAQPLQYFDAWLVSQVGQVEANGNVLSYADGDGFAYLLQGCMSLANASLAILVWLTAARLIRPEVRRADLGWAAAVMVSVVILNTTRIAVVMQSRANYAIYHDGWGSVVFSVLMLVAALTLAALSVRKNLFD